MYKFLKIVLNLMCGKTLLFLNRSRNRYLEITVFPRVLQATIHAEKYYFPDDHQACHMYLVTNQNITACTGLYQTDC